VGASMMGKLVEVKTSSGKYPSSAGHLPSTSPKVMVVLTKEEWMFLFNNIKPKSLEGERIFCEMLFQVADAIGEKEFMRLKIL